MTRLAILINDLITAVRHECAAAERLSRTLASHREWEMRTQGPFPDDDVRAAESALVSAANAVDTLRRAVLEGAP